ncbi:MAG: site-2 protease family protein [Chloroflexi bacterium]|nr:site-2 protease family protein [Chloroflexota bacterium]MCI0832806.1 site-2 protease family protein [Chloroflexota bacterium]
MEALRIGRIFGIDIRIHWSWLAIFFLLLWVLANGFYDQESYSHWATAERWLASGVTTILFFVSILLHELSHSLVARRLGLPVHSITLFIFGGVSSLTQEPESPGQEFKITIVGPLMSFALGIIGGVIYLALHLSDMGTSVPGAIAFYLAFINIAVGIFNLLPGYPLDGGRVLRAGLWARTGSMLRATRWAARVGTIIAFGLMALGVLSVVATENVVGGVWFIVIGWFLRNTSEQAYQQLLYRNTLEGAKVGDIIDRSFEGAPPDIPLSELVNDYILGRGQRCVPVVVEGNLLGLITIGDLRAFPPDEWATTSAFRAMTPREQLYTIASADELMSALELMAANDVHQLPVIDGFAFSGFVTRADVIRRIQVRAELAGLRD